MDRQPDRLVSHPLARARERVGARDDLLADRVEVVEAAAREVRELAPLVARAAAVAPRRRRAARAVGRRAGLAQREHERDTRHDPGACAGGGGAEGTAGSAGSAVRRLV